MDKMEAGLFEADRLHKLFIKIREWDDKAKIKNLPLPDLPKYKEMTVKHLMSN